MEYLLSLEEIDINQSSESGDTALHLASQKGLWDIVELLVEEGDADVNRRYDKFTVVLSLGFVKYFISVNKYSFWRILKLLRFF